MKLDFNFYPEHNMHELDDLRDIAVPTDWTVGQLITALHDAKVMLWNEILHVDDDGNVWWG
jgi:hypothetical protein